MIISAINEILIISSIWFSIFYMYRISSKEVTSINESKTLSYEQQEIENTEMLGIGFKSKLHAPTSNEGVRCANCGKYMIGHDSKGKKYCSAYCRNKAHQKKKR